MSEKEENRDGDDCKTERNVGKRERGKERDGGGSENGMTQKN